ncbi:MAG: tetratricopeptide repeat protein [Pyrinomonadaceae bacterium]|nr:tetratricopeptide repeat protein [Pyrinomonadaceae bacterium]
MVFALLFWNAGRAGLSSLLSSYGATTNQIAAADLAVELSQRDPHANYLRATILRANNDLAGAINEYNRAISLRPDDYGLWLSLARARALNDETDEALAASRQAVKLAPYYAHPRWQLGNLLLRAGEQDEAFKELRVAGASNPSLLPAVIDLAWQLSEGDAQFVKQSIQPQTPETYLALAEYFRKRRAVVDAIDMYRSTGEKGKQNRSAYVSELTSTKRFNDAYALWLIEHPANSHDALGVISDAGFEQESNLEEPGFGWRTINKGPSLHLDMSAPEEGRSSLRVDFDGNSDPTSPVISQLLLVEPVAHYQISFATRTEEIVTGGPPLLIIVDANNQQVIGRSAEFPRETAGWQYFTVDFNSTDSTAAIQITLQRQPCSTSPCPIFGRVWLDAFSLRKL